MYEIKHGQNEFFEVVDIENHNLILIQCFVELILKRQSITSAFKCQLSAWCHYWFFLKFPRFNEDFYNISASIEFYWLFVNVNQIWRKYSCHYLNQTFKVKIVLNTLRRKISLRSRFKLANWLLKRFLYLIILLFLLNSNLRNRVTLCALMRHIGNLIDVNIVRILRHVLRFIYNFINIIEYIRAECVSL